LLILHKCILSKACPECQTHFKWHYNEWWLQVCDLFLHSFTCHHDGVMKGGWQPCFLLVHMTPVSGDWYNHIQKNKPLFVCHWVIMLKCRLALP
jgi:hypothetical protein